MKINGHDNLMLQASQEGWQAKAAQRQAAKLTDRLDEGFGKLLEQAMHPADAQTKVEQARQALRSGQLETDAAFEAAAEAMLNFGL